MNGYKRRLVMNKYDITPEQDFILGLVYEKRVMPATDILSDCIKLEVCSHATAHKYFKSLVIRDFLRTEQGKDSRYKNVFLSSKGVSYLEETK
jgi:DNA-binding MarR family transcriptional regulator